MQKTNRIVTLFLLNCFSNYAFGQFEYIDQDSLIALKRVKTINEFFHFDSSQTENDERWVYDAKGRLSYSELLPIDDDSTNSPTTYIYSNDKLIETRHIGVWDIKTYKLDTGYTFYEYNSNNTLHKVIYYNTNDFDTTTTNYVYTNGLLSEMTIYDGLNRVWGIDSIKYFSNGQRKKLTRTGYHGEKKPFYQATTYYDSLGLIQTIVHSEIDNGCIYATQTKNFFYRNNKLQTVKECYFDNSWHKAFSYSETHFNYNKNGLLEKRERYSNGELLTYDTFTYEYYPKGKKKGNHKH